MTHSLLIAAGVIVSVACLGLPAVAAAGNGPDYVVLSSMDDPGEWAGPCAPQSVTDADGRKSLVFDFGDGGQGEWDLKTFPACEADFDSYHVLSFDFRVEGGGANISTNVRKWPWFGGYLALFYQVDDIYQPREWVTETAGIHAPENAWKGTFSKDEPCFKLSISGSADAGKRLRVYVDNIRIVRYPVTVDCIDDLYMHFGEREDQPGGGLTYRYPLTLRNHTATPCKVQLRLDATSLTHFQPAVPDEALTIPGSGQQTVLVTLTLDAAARDKLPPTTSERAVVTVVPDQDETLAYPVTLQAAVPHKLPGHPCLFANREQLDRAKDWQEKWGWARDCAAWYIKRADFAMATPVELPEYRPRAEQPGDLVCNTCEDKTDLYWFSREDSAFRYQCLTCGNMLSPKAHPLRGGSLWAFQDDGYWWHPKRPNPKNPEPAHAITFNRAGNLLDLAVAWHLTGKQAYLDRAAAVLAEYAHVLPTSPFLRDSGSSRYCFFNAKGSFKVGNYFSQNGWLHRMACTLDLLWDSGAVPQNVRTALLRELRSMAINRMRMVNTGSHRLNEALAAVSMLSGDANLLAYALDDPRMGARPTLHYSILPDGMNYMAGQYMVPVMAAWMPVLQTYRNAGLDLPGQIPGLRKYAIAIQKWLDPDGLSPSLGDAKAAASLGLKDHMELCYAWFGDPDSVNGVQRQMFKQWRDSKWRTPWESLPRQGGNVILARGAALFRCAENIPRGNPPPLRGSTNFPDYGLLVFNQGQGDRQLWAAIPYGKQLGHGHHDNLHLEWWALGQKISQKQGSRSRHHALHENTLLVDSKDQCKVPCQLVEFADAGPVQGAVLRSAALYPGTTLTRIVMLYDGLVFLLDTFVSETAHDYDMVYANAGTMHCDLPFTPRGQPLGTEQSDQGFPVGYASLQDVQQAVPPDMLQVVWDNLAEPDLRVRLAQLALGERGTLLRVKAPLVVCDWKKITGDTDAAGYTRLPRNAKAREDRSDFMGSKLIRRINAPRAALLTVLEPYHGDAPRLEKIERLPFSLNGAPSTTGIVLRYVSDGVTHQILMCPEAGAKSGGGWTTPARFTAGTFGALR